MLFELNPTLINYSEESSFLLQEKAASIRYFPKCAICRKRMQGEYRLHFIAHNFGYDIKTGIYVSHEQCEDKAKRIAYRQSEDPYAVICGLIHISGVNPV